MFAENANVATAPGAQRDKGANIPVSRIRPEELSGPAVPEGGFQKGWVVYEMVQ